MYYKVPQKIALQDKIIGPLTFRQFLYLLAGILPSFIIAKILEKFGLNILLGAFFTFPIWLPAVLLAFGKFQDQNLDQVLIAFIQFIRMPKKLIWQNKTHKPRVKILAKSKRKIQYSRPRTLESRLQQLHKEISIYGTKKEQAASQEEKRIIAQPKANLIIKTKIQPLTKLPKQEQAQMPESQQPQQPQEELKAANSPPETTSSPREEKTTQNNPLSGK